MYPEKRIVNETTKQQRKDGVSELEIQKQNAIFLNLIANNYFDEIINSHNTQASNAIEKLASHGQWPNLGKIAIHAMKAKIQACQQSYNYGSKISGRMIENSKLHYDILKMSIPELIQVIKPEFLEKYDLLRTVICEKS